MSWCAPRRPRLQTFPCRARPDNLATPGRAVSVMLYLLRTGAGIWDFATLSLYLFEGLERFALKRRENLSQEQVTDCVGEIRKEL